MADERQMIPKTVAVATESVKFYEWNVAVLVVGVMLALNLLCIYL